MIPRMIIMYLLIMKPLTYVTITRNNKSDNDGICDEYKSTDIKLTKIALQMMKVYIMKVTQHIMML